MEKKNINLIIVLLFLISNLSFSQDVFADYKIHFDRVHLTNYVQTMNDNFKVISTEDGSLTISDSGNFKVHDSGGRHIDVILKDGVINGRYEEYYNNGNLFTLGTYVNGKKEGQWKIYAENGKLWKVYEYKNDELNGKYISYYTNNGLESERGTYVNGLLNGEWVENYSSGQKKITGNYENGKRKGTFTEWYTNGVKKSSMDYNNDEVNGKVLVYYESGRLLYEADMIGREGILKGYHLDGRLGFEGKINNNQRIGKWNFYDSLGNLYTAIEY